jgi:hypothetical protein
MNTALTFLMRSVPGVARVVSVYALLRRGNFLDVSGWLRSFRSRESVDAAGEPIPWFTYAAVSFFQNRTKPDWRVFEFGCGNSTLWWAGRVAGVVSCEHDADWYARMKARVPGHVRLMLVSLDDTGDYERSIHQHHERFHVVVIDGRRRNACACEAVRVLTPDGVIVWDNTEREAYKDGCAFLRGEGFKQLDFTGLGPITAGDRTTSVFYRESNCLGL